MTLEQGLPDPRPLVHSEERPWGGFERLSHNSLTTVKIIRVDPGHRLSLQRHAKRGEFWVVLDGPLVVEVDGDERVHGAGDKVWVPLGAVHRVANRGERPCRFLEIGYGDFDEGDIERLEDDYSRG